MKLYSINNKDVTGGFDLFLSYLKSKSSEKIGNDELLIVTENRLCKAFSNESFRFVSYMIF